MRLPTDTKIVMMTIVMLFLANGRAKAYDLVLINPLEIVAIAEGNEKINSLVNDETSKMIEISVMEGTMIAEESMIKKWSNEYNSYLKKAEGYAQSLKAGSTIYLEGMLLLRNVMDVVKAVRANPQGVGASIVLTDVYMEAAIELTKVLGMLKYTVSKGGAENMLNGAERTALLWSLSDEMKELNRKLRTLAVSICFYDFEDVMYYATRGLTALSHETIAKRARRSWIKQIRVCHLLAD